MSVVANMTPFSEYNQSPRNMYQCQMGKQTMGTPCHSIQNRADNKLYRINFPQSPILKTKTYDHYRFDDYPLGTNAIVAVISYSVNIYIFFNHNLQSIYVHNYKTLCWAGNIFASFCFVMF